MIQRIRYQGRILTIGIVLFFGVIHTCFSQTIIRNERPSLLRTTFGVSPNFGNVIDAFSFEVPKGVNGVAPNLNVFYSTSLKNSILGVGWELPFDHITRSTKRGVPGYDVSDEFILFTSGTGEELVAGEGNIFYKKIESDFRQVEFVNEAYWLIQDKDGTKYYFGQDDNSKQYNSGDIFSWYLTRVEDVHGNYLTMTYQKDSGEIYPQYIDYTANDTQSLSPYARVEFVLEDRFVPHQTYAPGFLIKTTKRISRINISVDGQTQRAYQLAYESSQSTQRDLLTSITQIGANGGTLPATVFSYYDSNKGFALDSSASIPSGVNFTSSGRDQGVRVADVNGDAYPDIIKNFYLYDGYQPLQQHTKTIYTNNKSNGWVNNSSLTPPGDCDSYYCSSFISELVESGVVDGQIVPITTTNDFALRITDIDGDGYNDFIQGQRTYILNNGSVAYDLSYQKAYLNNSSGWGSDQSSWHLPSDAILAYWFTTVQSSGGSISFGVRRESLGNIFSDVNNDGYVDIVTSRKRNTSSDVYSCIETYRKAYLNNKKDGGTGWTASANWTPPNTIYADFWDGATLVDLNGDNLPEIFYKKASTVKIYMNHGRGWEEDSVSPWLDTSGLGDLSDGSTQFGDINGDGLIDMIIAKGGSSAGSRVLLNTGDGWVQDDGWIIPEANFVNLGSRLLDANADTLLDALIMDGGTPRLYLNQGKPADLLYEIDNSYGGVTTIETGTSAQFNNTFLPFPTLVVTKITKSDSRGHFYETDYDYAEGLWDADDREFRGFGHAKKIDPEGNYTETRFHQDDTFKGKMSYEGSFAANQSKYSEIKYEWASESIADGADFVYLARKDECAFDGYAEGRCAAEVYSYDESPQRGNLTKGEQLGEVDEATGTDITGDSRTIETVYHNNVSEGNYLSGLPKHVLTRNDAGDIVRQVWFYYDGNQSLEDLPVKGLLTRKEEWAGEGEQTPVTQYAYDTVGNLTAVTDPLNNVTTITYDEAFKLFPLLEVNPLSHETTKEYYGVNGVALDSGDGYTGLWGQLKTTRDPNGQESKNVYDEFGRLTASVSPLDSIQYPFETRDYIYAADHMATTM